MPMMTKVCRKCGERKPLDAFQRHPQMADGHLHHCKGCRAAYEKEHKAADPRYARRHRDWHYKNRYGVSLDEVEAMAERQGGRCAICRREARLVLDHDHATGRARGLICHGCNVGLGAFRDEVDALLRAALYLRAG